ncbi:hypothetical protein MC885_004684, partial [Smutsia gigantea]
MGSPLLQEHGTYVLVQRGRVGPLLAMSPYWRTWVTGIQSWQRSYAGCPAYPPMGDGRRRRMGTRRGHQEQGPPSRPRRWVPAIQDPLAGTRSQ